MNSPASMQGLPHLSADWAGRLVKRLPALASPAATGALVVVIAWQAARLTWLWLPQPSEPPAPAAGPSVITPAAVNVQQIADAHLFGVASADASADLSNAPQTSMTLMLSGIIATDDPAKGYAFIGESLAAAKLVRAGDPVAGGARLHSVFPDRVILERGGRLESLSLPRANLGAALQRPAPTPLPGSTPPQFAQDLRRIVNTNPGLLTEIIRPQPVFEGGAQKGFRVYPGRNRQQFESLGLQPGDMVTAVNGAALDDPARASQILNQLETTDRVTVTVVRNNQTQQLTLNTAQIHLPQPGDAAAPPAESRPALAPGAEPTQ